MLVLRAACIALRCDRSAPTPGADREIPVNVVRELDAIRDVSRSAHDAYERLYTSVVFAPEEQTVAAARRYRSPEQPWVFLQLDDLRRLRQGQRASICSSAKHRDSVVEARPAVSWRRRSLRRSSKRSLLALRS